MDIRTIRKAVKDAGQEPLGLLAYELRLPICRVLPSGFRFRLRHGEDWLAIRVSERNVDVPMYRGQYARSSAWWVISADPLHPGNYRACQLIAHIHTEYATYIPPRLRHEAGYDSMLHADALGQELEEDCVVGHAQRIRVCQRRFVYARSGLRICQEG